MSKIPWSLNHFDHGYNKVVYKGTCGYWAFLDLSQDQKYFTLTVRDFFLVQPEVYMSVNVGFSGARETANKLLKTLGYMDTKGKTDKRL